MKILFELSREHQKIPTDEILSIIKGYKNRYEIVESNKNILIVDSDFSEELIKKLANRVSMCFFIDQYLFSCKPSVEIIKHHAKQHNNIPSGSISVKYLKRSDKTDSQQIVKSLAEIYTKDREVDLSNSDVEIRVVITDEKIYAGIKKYEIKRGQFEERKVQNRPFFSPISLHPKIARALVNLSSICEDQVLLDPFCGTGGILIEAGLIGVKTIGGDIEEKMIKGCKQNLEFYNINNHELYNLDIGEIHKKIKSSDAIVTDLPYGKSTTTKGEKIKNLSNRTFQCISEILKKDGKAVIGLSQPELIKQGEKYLKLVEIYGIKAHRSLTRYFVIYEKI